LRSAVRQLNVGSRSRGHRHVGSNAFDDPELLIGAINNDCNEPSRADDRQGARCLRCPDRPCPDPLASIAIRSIQPDREHAVLEIVGAPGLDSVDELWQRVEGLLVAGVRYLLVDLADAVPGDAVVSVLAETTRRLEQRQGWLRLNGQCSSLPVGLTEATLDELFSIYRAFARAAGRWDGAHA
jgi:hypothetical protein